MSKKVVGFFGGSFDPIHFGHIGLAVELLEEYRLDEILFCPAFCSPFKQAHPPFAPPKDRLEMLKRALDHPQFKICTLEIDRGGVSYTIDTLRSLENKEMELRLILSDEAASKIDQWKSSKEIQRIAPLLIGQRGSISSTKVRERLKKKLYCGHLIPSKALDYILQHRLYSREEKNLFEK